MADKKTFSVVQAAKRLGISRQAAYKAIERGDLKARKVIVKTEFRISEKALESYTVDRTRQQNGRIK